MATTGVTCNTTASGNSTASRRADSVNTAAINTPPAIASKSANTVIFSVNHQLAASEEKFSSSVISTKLGAGSV